MWAIARLPFRLQIKIGQLLGLLFYAFGSKRRHIGEVNLKLCFPELSDSERRGLLRETFLANGIGLVEVGLAWYRDPEDFRRRVSVHGLEYLRQAKAQGRGVLLVGAHFSTLEWGGILFTLFDDMDATYRPHKNPLFNQAMVRARRRRLLNVIARKDVRGALRSLKQGHILWYAPDQDYGPKHSVFVEFFGVTAATITATSRFAAYNNSPVVLFSHYRNADNSGYDLHFSAPLVNYPSGDETADAARINTLIEQAVRKHPEQYLWLHRRFKTQAAGKAARPYKA